MVMISPAFGRQRVLACAPLRAVIETQIAVAKAQGDLRTDFPVHQNHVRLIICGIHKAILLFIYNYLESPPIHY